MLQALSNIVFAYEKAKLLDRELLQWVYNMATFRLEHIDRTGSPYSTFKPQVRKHYCLICCHTQACTSKQSFYVSPSFLKEVLKYQYQGTKFEEPRYMFFVLCKSHALARQFVKLCYLCQSLKAALD